GVFFSLLALCAYLRARRRGSEGAWRLTGLSFLALFLIKYNYALLWAAVVIANEALAEGRDRRAALARRLGRFLWPWNRSEATVGERVAAVYAYLVIVCLALGINAGYLLYAGILVATAIVVRRALRDRRALIDRWRALVPAVRAILATVVIPLWLWFLSPWPVHPKEILAFLRNRQTGPPLASLASLLYYPRTFLDDYSIAPFGVAVAVLALLALVLRLLARRSRLSGHGDRALLLAAGLSLLLPTLHAYKQERFLATAVPFLLLLAEVVAARLAFAL